MAKKLYVGNLTYNVNESDLEALFTPFGTVQSAQIIVDRDTNRSKGFGFVEMDTDAQAQAAIQGLNGHEHDGRQPDGQRSQAPGGPWWRRRSAAATAVVAVVGAVAAVAMAAEAVAVGVIDRSILPHGQGASQRGSLIDLPLDRKHSTGEVLSFLLAPHE